MGKIISSNKSLYFCFPYHEVGGVSVLFLRMAQTLSKKIDNPIHLVDYADGYMATHNKSSKIKLLEYKDDQPVLIPEDGILILQSMTPWSIFPSLKIHDNAQVFFWNCHPYNLVPTFPGIRNFMYSSSFFTKLMLSTLLISFKIKMRVFLEVLQDNKAIAFMDRTNVEVTQGSLDVKIRSQTYLPVAIDHCSLEINLSKQELSKEIRAAWIGRVADFKVHILLYSINKLSSWAMEHKKKCSFTVIGTGEFLDFLRSSVQAHDFFELRFVKNLSTNELRDFLKNECDVLFAMGTSALEGASLGVPSVLLDIAYGKIKGDYLFKFLFEETGCVLGDILSSKSFKKDNKSLERILGLLENNFAIVSQQSFEHCKKYHSIEVVTDNLIDCLSSNELTFFRLQKSGVLNPSYAYQIFRILRKKIAKK